MKLFQVFYPLNLINRFLLSCSISLEIDENFCFHVKKIFHRGENSGGTPNGRRRFVCERSWSLESLGWGERERERERERMKKRWRKTFCCVCTMTSRILDTKVGHRNARWSNRAIHSPSNRQRLLNRIRQTPNYDLFFLEFSTIVASIIRVNGKSVRCDNFFLETVLLFLFNVWYLWSFDKLDTFYFFFLCFCPDFPILQFSNIQLLNIQISRSPYFQIF